MTRPRNWLTTALRLVAGIAIAVPAALLLGASPAAAHPMPHSVVQLDVYKASVTARLELPVDDFSRASGIDLTSIEPAALPARATAVRAYLGRHIRPTTLQGRGVAGRYRRAESQPHRADLHRPLPRAGRRRRCSLLRPAGTCGTSPWTTT